MKTFVAFLICTLLLSACSRKNVPQRSNNGKVIIENNSGSATTESNTKNDSGNVFAGDSASNTNINTSASFIVVSDGFGKVADPGDSTIKFNQLQLSKGFSSQQKLNLKTRYNTIPPRALYVNPKNQQVSARGSYYILAKKFWYWKKADGLFYLDEKYYL